MRERRKEHHGAAGPDENRNFVDNGGQGEGCDSAGPSATSSVWPTQFVRLVIWSSLRHDDETSGRCCLCQARIAPGFTHAHACDDTGFIGLACPGCEEASDDELRERMRDTAEDLADRARRLADAAGAPIVRIGRCHHSDEVH